MIKVIRINTETGLYIEDVIIQNGELTPDDCIEVPCVNGFYIPKWNGTEWVEGLTQAEIEAKIKESPTIPNPNLTIEERIAQLELLYLKDSGVII